MPDIADRAQQDIERHQAAMQTEYVLPAGQPGVCSECDEHSQRLIGGLCATCRGVRERANKRRG